MESCQICSSALDSRRAINCSGSCGKIFHFACVGISKSNYAAWCAKIGFFWFCESCRLSFNPVLYDREKTIMKALRELLIRTDSMDTRLGCYGENLRKINRTLYDSQARPKSANNSLDHTAFLKTIDEMTLDDTIEEPISHSRSCDNTSFFEVLDEVNSSIALIPEKFVVGGNKRVQIITNPSGSSVINKEAPRANASTPAASERLTASSSKRTNSNSTDRNIDRTTEERVGDNCNIRGSSARPNISLKVATNLQASNDVESLYVTPFAPDQKEEEIKQYVVEVSNVDPSLVKVTKLVPRGKNENDLSFVSFKVCISKSVSSMVSDSWYWPDGVTVRPFDPNPKNGAVARLPIA